MNCIEFNPSQFSGHHLYQENQTHKVRVLTRQLDSRDVDCVIICSRQLAV